MSTNEHEKEVVPLNLLFALDIAGTFFFGAATSAAPSGARKGGGFTGCGGFGGGGGPLRMSFDQLKLLPHSKTAIYSPLQNECKNQGPA